MRIILAIDGSPYSVMSIGMLKALQLPPTTVVTVMTVVPEHTFLGGITIDRLLATASAREQIHKVQEQRATTLLEAPVEELRATGVNVESLVCRGKPAEQIMKKAQNIGADLIVLGAKGVSNSTLFPLGSVAQKVIKYADCSVLLIREGPHIITRIFLATDGSKYVEQVIRLLLDLPLPKQSQVTLLTALHSHMAAMTKVAIINQQSDNRILADLQTAEGKMARSFMNETKKQFENQGYEASLWILRGEPAEEILKAANELNPELIALGARGLTNVKPILLGNVAERVARFSKYSVLIGRSHK